MKKSKKLDKLLILVMVWTLTNQILIMANDASSESEETTSEELPEDCTYLNKSSGKPTTQNTTNIDVLEILNDGSKYLVDKIDRFIGIFGLTGVGKTVMSYILAGDLNKIHAVLTEGGNLVIVDEDNKIGAPSTVSRTLVPNILYKIEEDGNRTAFMDSPGYGDNRGYETDIAANFFINQMMKKAKEVKFLFLTVHSSVIPGHDRTSFPNLVSYASRFIKNIEKYENSIGLVVTKVKSYNDRGMFQKDKKLLNEVVGFIKDFNKTLYEKLEQSNSTDKTEILQNQIKMVEILLHQDGKGRYDRIVFSRSPEKCGPLSQSEFVLQTRKNLGKLYNGLNYAAADSSDFGYTLKPTSLLELKVEKEGEINELIANATTELISNFWGFYYNSQLNAKVDNPRDIYDRISKTVERISGWDASLSALNQSSSPDEILNALESVFNSEGYQIPEQLINVLNTQSKLLTFFDEANNGKMKRELASWMAPIFSMKQGFKDYKSWYEFCINLEDKMKLYSRPEIPNGRQLPTSTIGLLNLLEELNYGPAINAKLLSRRVNQNALEVFDKIMHWAFDSVRKECDYYVATYRISGNFIKLSDYFDKNGKIKSICYGKIHAIQFNAAHTIFFDNDVNLKGEEFSLLIFAYNWVAVKWVNINLDGLPGSPKMSTFDLNVFGGYGKKGWDGLAGNPGGPGGAFSGLILGKGESLYMISIRAVGGKGGNGENGGDGNPGTNGGRPDVKYTEAYECGWERGDFPYRYRYYCGQAKPGGSGGDGGNGGEGGFGGNSGRVSVVSLKTSTAYINIRTGKGEIGSSGLGGSGGPGGWSGVSAFCTKTEFIVVQVHRDCEYEETNIQAPSGTSGRLWGSQRDKTWPRSLPYTVNEQTNFKNFFTFGNEYGNWETRTALKDLSTWEQTKTLSKYVVVSEG